MQPLAQQLEDLLEELSADLDCDTLLQYAGFDRDSIRSAVSKYRSRKQSVDYHFDNVAKIDSINDDIARYVDRRADAVAEVEALKQEQIKITREAEAKIEKLTQQIQTEEALIGADATALKQELREYSQNHFERLAQIDAEMLTLENEIKHIDQSTDYANLRVDLQRAEKSLSELQNNASLLPLPIRIQLALTDEEKELSAELREINKTIDLADRLDAIAEKNHYEQNEFAPTVLFDTLRKQLDCKYDVDSLFDFAERCQYASGIIRVNADRMRNAILEIKSKLPELRSKATSLQAQLSVHEAKRATIRNYYIDQLAETAV